MIKPMVAPEINIVFVRSNIRFVNQYALVDIPDISC